MSLNSKQNVRCPNCGQMSEVTVWDSVTVSDSADLKQDLLRGEVNMFFCPSCSYKALMPTPILYHDEDKKLMISFSPCADAVTEQRLFDKVRETSKKSGELGKLEGYNLRFVTDYNELLEKILIFDYALNDKTIEVIKLMILSQDVDKSVDRVCRFGKSENGVMEFVIYDVKENQTYTSSVPIETYYTVDESLKQSGVKPYSFDWEMVNASYATKLLQGFNN